MLNGILKVGIVDKASNYVETPYFIDNVGVVLTMLQIKYKYR